MDIQADILETLKCSICDNYLSCAPILVKPNGDSVCGRCEIPDEEKHLAVRMNAYERLACMMSFPCCYREDGCMTKLQMADVEKHEAFCKFQKLKCPSENCPWIDSRTKLLEHFIEKHSEFILKHPCIAELDTTRNYELNMLTRVTDQIFLVQLKCNKTTDKLHHCVRYIGNAECAKNCEYNFEIVSGKRNLLNTSQVLATDNFEINEDSNNEIDIRAVLNLLGKEEDIKFSVTIHYSVPKTLSTQCSNFPNGCMYMDDSISDIEKHQVWFCNKQKNKCYECGELISGLFQHYMDKHVQSCCNKLADVDLDMNRQYIRGCITDNAIFLCQWNFLNNYLQFTVISDLRKTENKLFNLILSVSNPYLGYSKNIILQLDDSSCSHDWVGILKSDVNQPIIEKKIKSSTFNCKYSIVLEIIKK